MVKTGAAKRKTPASASVSVKSSPRQIKEVLKEPSTIAGILSITSQLLLAGPASLTSPGVWAGVLAGVGLVLTKEGR